MLRATVLGLLTFASVISTSEAWQMKAVRSVQARVQGGKPVWDETKKMWLASFGKTVEDKYRAGMDSVNTASVEGALMYVQSEGIDQSIVQGCERKNGMQYIWFYDINIVQPNTSLAEYGSVSTYPEFCPYSAMDSGACTPISDANNQKVLPTICNQYAGLNYTAKIGLCVGGEDRIDHPRAPYKNNIWFSYPNSCYTKTFPEKNDTCRASVNGGLCPLGIEPNGVDCTFSYKILGYVNIDDIVGISDLKNAEGKPYKNRTDFCNQGGIEFNGEKMLPFWNDPKNATANEERSTKMVEIYQSLVEKATVPNMIKLPTVAELTEVNPPCYTNTKACENSCRRKLLAQVCTKCTDGADCKKKPASEPSVPALEKAPVPTRPPTQAPTTKSVEDGGAGGGATFPSPNTPGKPATSSTVALAVNWIAMVIGAALFMNL